MIIKLIQIEKLLKELGKNKKILMAKKGIKPVNKARGQHGVASSKPTSEADVFSQ